MTREELEEQIDRAVQAFSGIEGITDELAEMLVGEGFLSYDDLSVIEPDDLMSMGGLTAEQVEHIVEQAESKAEEAELAAAAERRRQRELDTEEVPVPATVDSGEVDSGEVDSGEVADGPEGANTDAEAAGATDGQDAANDDTADKLGDGGAVEEDGLSDDVSVDDDGTQKKTAPTAADG